jgi:hypothetical protein
MSPVLAAFSPHFSLAVDARVTINILALLTTGWQGALEVVAVGLGAATLVGRII